MPGPEFWKPFYEGTETPPWDLGAPSPALRRLFVVKGPIPPAHILVPGAGRGHDAAWLATLGHRVTAVDFIDQALVEARRIAEEMDVEVELVNADVLDLPPEWSGRFDAIAEHTCYAAIHPDDRRQYAGELFRVLRPGGHLLGTWFDHTFPEREDPMAGPPYPSTRQEIIAHMEKAGFALEKLEPTEAFPKGEGRVQQCAGVFTKPAR